MYRIYPLNDIALELEERYLKYLTSTDARPLHGITITHNLEVQTGPAERNFHGLIINVPTMVVPTTYVVDSLPCYAEWRSLVLSFMNDHLNSILGWTKPTTRMKSVLSSVFPLYYDDNKDTFNRKLAITLATQRRTRLLENHQYLVQAIHSPVPNINVQAVSYVRENRFLPEGDMVVDYKVLETGKKAYEREVSWRNALQSRYNENIRELQSVDTRLRLLHADAVDPAIMAASETFYIEVIAPIQEKIIDWVEDAMGEEESAQWKIWYLRTIGMDVMLEDGPDFRVVDWTNRMQSGDWKREETSHILDD